RPRAAAVAAGTAAAGPAGWSPVPARLSVAAGQVVPPDGESACSAPGADAVAAGDGVRLAAGSAATRSSTTCSAGAASCACAPPPCPLPVPNPPPPGNPAAPPPRLPAS